MESFNMHRLPKVSRNEVLAALDSVHPLVLAAFATALHALFYGLANQFPLGEPRTLPLTVLDRAIPFLPLTVWLYLSDYLLVLVAFLALKDRLARVRFVEAFLVIVVAAAAVHWVFPVAFERALYPVPRALDPLSHAALTLLRAVDSPLSCFPSLHVATASISVIAAWRAFGQWRWAGALWALGIAVSTLTLKQHYVVDVLGGFVLAGCAGAWLWARRKKDNAGL